jgi:hypothetical protein
MVPFWKRAVSAYPAKSQADLRLDGDIYKADFEIAANCQGVCKDLLRISLAGLGVFGFLIKFASLESSALLEASTLQKCSAMASLAFFALCASCALYNSSMTNQGLDYQLIICRFFGRIESERWDEMMKQNFRNEVQRLQGGQKRILQRGHVALVLAKLFLVSGAVSVAVCCGLVIFSHRDCTTRPLGMENSSSSTVKRSLGSNASVSSHESSRTCLSGD